MRATLQKTRRWGDGTAAVVRWLIHSASPLSGAGIARSVGITQPRAVQVLSMLTDLDAVESTPEGFRGDRDRLFELYLERTRPRVSAVSHWYSTRPLLDQAAAIAQLPRPEDLRIGLSADLGPDMLVPWRHPTVAIVYSTADLDLPTAGFVTAEGESDATVVVRTVADRRLFGPSDLWPSTIDGIPLVDPVQQWWDLHDLGGSDRIEAADHLRQAILERRLPT